MPEEALEDGTSRGVSWRNVGGWLVAAGSLVGTGALGVVAGWDQLWVWPVAALILLVPFAMVAYWLQDRFPDLLWPWAERLLSLLAHKFPFVAWLGRQREIRKQNANLLDDFDAALAAYHLTPVPAADRRRLAGSGSLLSPGRLAHRFGGVAGRPSGDALDLVYRERYGQPRLNLWLSGRAELAGELAPVVKVGDRLPRRDDGFPYDADAVRTLLSAQRSFSVDVLAGTLRLLGDLWRRMERYQHFLEANHVPTLKPSPSEVLAHVERQRGLPVNAETLYRLRDPGLALRLLEACEHPDTPDGLRVVHRGIFLAEVDLDAARLRERVARLCLAPRQPEPIRLLHAYLFAKDEHGVASLAQLDSHGAEWIAEARRLCSDPAAELSRLRWDLQAGYWPTARRHIGRATTRPPTTPETGFAAVEAGIDGVPARTGTVLGPRFKEILDAIELDRTLAGLDTYMITFDSHVGELRPMVDCLADPQFEERLDGLGVEFRDAAGDQIYAFGPYTAQTRIGLAPRGTTFEAFYQRFRHDFQVVFDNRATLFPGNTSLQQPVESFDQLELTLNRIDLSRSRYVRFAASRPGVSKLASIRVVYEAIYEKVALTPGERASLLRVVEQVEGRPTQTPTTTPAASAPVPAGT